MSEERKKAQLKEIPKVEPKKRPEPEVELEVDKKPRAKASDDKFVRICIESTKEEVASINDRVLKGQLKWAYYAYDNGKGYHHYLEIK